MTAEVVVPYQAKQQFSRLSTKERAALTRLLSQPSKPERNERGRGPGRLMSHLRRNRRADSTESEHTEQAGSQSGFVSRFGRDKRVYWKKSNDGKIVVLSIVAAASPSNEPRRD
jgi:hypothetical protein